MELSSRKIELADFPSTELRARIKMKPKKNQYWTCSRKSARDQSENENEKYFLLLALVGARRGRKIRKKFRARKVFSSTFEHLFYEKESFDVKEDFMLVKSIDIFFRKSARIPPRKISLRSVDHLK